MTISRPAAPESETLKIEWRCYRCDEVFTDKRLAAEHFGPDEEFTEPGCVERLNNSEKELRAQIVSSYQECVAAQDAAHQAEQRAEQSERRLSLAQTEIKGHMRIAKELRSELANMNDEMVEARARIAELKKDAARLDYLEREMEMEQEMIRRGKGTDPMYPSLFRRNMPITRAAIDAALKDRA